MRIRYLAVAVIAVLLFVAAGCQKTETKSDQPPQKPCDRACLEAYVDKYMDAMLAHDPSPQLFAKDIKFTENGVRLPFGNEGLWFDMAGKGTYKFYVPDVETQQIAFIGTAREGGSAPRAKTAATEVNAKLAAANPKPNPSAKPAEPTIVAIALRLKIANGLITEAEQLVIRPEIDLFGGGSSSKFPPTGVSVEKIGAPHKIFAEIIPQAERPSRDLLIKTANYYFTGLARNDGKGYYPFTDDCDRLENGMQTTNIPMKDPATAQTMRMGCKKQFEEGLKGVVSRIRDRRFVAVDRERGIVFAFGFFDHEQINWTWQIAELFKIEKGNIRRIEAVFQRCPYGLNSGWSTYEQGISEEIQNIK
jgi:hypothetical protein